VDRDADRPPPLIAEVIGWLVFVLFVAAIWKLRQTLDRSAPER